MPSVTSPSATMVTSPVDEDPWASAPVSRANSVHLRRRNRTRTNPDDMAPSSAAHPLAGAATSSTMADGAAEASRPTLRRLTTENERQLAEASRSGSEGGSMRGSLDLLRMTADPDADGVEVLIHKVSSGESLAGVSLQYGIDLATLRKANKLWASDTIHSRKQLYIPLEACRWNKATESFTRGPDADQITLTAKSAKKQGKEVDRSFSNLHLLDAERGTLPRSTSGSVYGGSEWGEEGEAARAFMPDTNLAYEADVAPEEEPRVSRPPTASEAASITSSSVRGASHTLTFPDDPSIRILTIIKLPSSQLQFFPKSQGGQSQDDSAQKDRRPSLPSKMPKSGSIRNNLHSLPPPLKSGKTSLTSSSSSNVVRLRPPTSSPQTVNDLSNNIASRLTSLFSVAPPPVPGHVRAATDSGFSSPRDSRRSSATSSHISTKPEALELHPRRSAELQRSSGLRPVQANGPHSAAKRA